MRTDSIRIHATRSLSFPMRTRMIFKHISHAMELQINAMPLHTFRTGKGFEILQLAP